MVEIYSGSNQKREKIVLEKQCKLIQKLQLKNQ
jgi:hypothetical protein